jgi:predicted ATPase
LLAALLSVGDEERYAPLPLSPQELRQKTLAAVLRLFEATASGAPLLIVVEDVHWIDPSTLELLNLLVARVRTCRILLLITFRPEFVSPWTVHAHVTTHTLKRLSRRNCEKIVSSILDRPLPAAVIAQIVSKTDGIPLFVEELTKSVLESGVLDAAGDQHQSPGSLTSLAIPDSLQDSLMARLDRLESVKELGQLAAAIGRIFSHELIAAVSPLSVNDLDSGLNRLVHAGLVYRRGTPPNAEYEFKHALVRDAAYESLLKRHRQRLHGNIADVLAERFPSIAENEPELLAQHYSDAGQHAPALDYWRRAGRRAVERSANTEAVRHLTKALEILVELPDTTERAQWELEMQLNLGTAWMSTKGMGASEVTRAYTQARVLSERVGETTQLFTSTWGLWLNNLQRGQGNTAHEFSGQLLNIAKGQSDAALELQAHHAAWTTTLLRGEAGGCREHSARGLALYDEELHRSHRFSYGGHDPGVCGGVFHGLALWLLGYPNQAEESIKEAVTLGRKLSHPFSSAVGLGFATFIHHFRGEPAAAEAWAKELIAICSDSSIPHFLAQGTILYGWAVAEQGRGKEGIDNISEGLENLRATGAKMLAPYFLAIAAESYARNEEYAKSARALEEAFESADQSGELWWTSELHRLRGRLLMATSKDVVEAEKSFVQALTIARQQQAKSLELRSATALAHLWQDQGKRDEARALLSPVCEWFTEGFDTADLTEAKTLLGALR